MTINLKVLAIIVALMMVVGGQVYKTQPVVDSSKEYPLSEGALGDLPSADVVSIAEWVSKASTIEALKSESQLVVKVRATSTKETRILRNEFPMMEGTKVVGTHVDELPFTDTTFDVLQVYQGQAQSKIIVMQTGRQMWSAKFEIRDDPLYKAGEEYVLFLVDISHDNIHANGRTLYRIVNPAGRYKISGNNVNSFSENQSASRPKTLGDLEAKIREKSK
ncbi:MAG: hypothetical protein KIH69_006120 [Anaerolineae bacterium]|nr:hypothetical protein [Anaerolineae bacterium]